MGREVFCFYADLYMLYMTDCNVCAVTQNNTKVPYKYQVPEYTRGGTDQCMIDIIKI